MTDYLDTAVTTQRLQQVTIQDDTLQLLIKEIAQGYVNPKIKYSYLHVFQDFSVVDGLVFRGTMLVAPASWRKTVATSSQLPHVCVDWFPGVDKLIEKEVAQCMPCQVTVSKNKQEPLKPTELPPEP